MGITAFRALAVVLSFVTFLGIVWWAWSRKNGARFEEAAQLPFVQDEDVSAATTVEQEETK